MFAERPDVMSRPRTEPVDACGRSEREVRAPFHSPVDRAVDEEPRLLGGLGLWLDELDVRRLLRGALGDRLIGAGVGLALGHGRLEFFLRR
jgi:hypothetical protein